MADFPGTGSFFVPESLRFWGFCAILEGVICPPREIVAKTKGVVAFAGVMKGRDFVREKEECL